MSEHLFEKENTIFERDILFSLKGIKWGKDFDINDNTYPVDDLRENNIFLEGVSSYLGIDADDVDAIINETEKRYNNKGIEFTKTVRQWLQGKKKPSQSQAYRHNCYDFCIALGMNINETFEFMFKHFQIYYFVSCYYWSKIRRDLKRKKPKYTRSEHLINDLDYDYLEKNKSNFEFNLELEFATYYESMNSNVLFCMKPHKYELRNLQYAINIRRRIIQDRKLRLTHNSIEIVVDEARILYLEQKYDEAKLRLNEVVGMFKCENRLPTMSLYRVHQFLGNIAATTGDYKTAVLELKRCLEIGEELELQDNYLVNVQLGRFLNENGDIEESEEHNAAILAVVEQLDGNARKSFLGDTLYNLATLQSMKGKPNTALKTFIKAVDEYTCCNARIEFIEIGKARCYRKMYEIYQTHRLFDAAKTKFEQAKEYYLSCLDKNHPEVVEFLSKAPQEITSSNDDKTS